MASSQSSTALKFIGAGAAVIAGGAAFGYLFGSVRDTHPTFQPVQAPVSSTLAPSPVPSPAGIHPRTTNGNYTAPGAPHIVIEEDRPVLRRALPPPAPPSDSEATQEAAPAAPRPAAETTPADTAHAVPSDTGTPPTANPDTTTSPAAPTPAAPTPAPADPDFEHINGSPKPAAGPSDPENSQQGGQGQGGSQGDGTKQFRVQTGAYTDESNARSVADTLRSQGYSASTRSERDGDHLVYKVQVGAYRSKNGANKAADDLQKKGYPAFISPIGP